MPAIRSHTCRIEYHADEIVVHGPAPECQHEANRILRRFAGSATPYRLDAVQSDRVVLSKVGYGGQ